jgi:hypothetical protein
VASLSGSSQGQVLSLTCLLIFSESYSFFHWCACFDPESISTKNYVHRALRSRNCKALPWEKHQTACFSSNIWCSSAIFNFMVWSSLFWYLMGACRTGLVFQFLLHDGVHHSHLTLLFLCCWYAVLLWYQFMGRTGCSFIQEFGFLLLVSIRPQCHHTYLIPKRVWKHQHLRLLDFCSYEVSRRDSSLFPTRETLPFMFLGKLYFKSYDISVKDLAHQLSPLIN